MAADLTHVKWHPATGVCLTNKVTLGSAGTNEPVRVKSEVNDEISRQTRVVGPGRAAVSSRHFPFTRQSEGRRYFLACRLKYSRWVWVRFTTDMRQETLFRGLVDCFNTLGFVPWVLVFDNIKTVPIARDDLEQPIWPRSLLQVAGEVVCP